MVLDALRSILGLINVEDAGGYVAHDLRRGHAQDILLRGGTLAEILRAGDWRSHSFLWYLDLHKLERDRTMEAHVADSSDGE